jgi:small conductance mechanosensitive channel
VDLRARLRADVRPSDLQGLLDRIVTVELRGDPRISLEEFDGDEVVVRLEATPARASEGPKLADEVLAAVATVSREGSEREAEAPAPVESGVR